MKTPVNLEAAVEMIAALNERTAAYDVRIAEMQADVDRLPLLEEAVVRLGHERDQANAAKAEVVRQAEAVERDNAALRQSLANYMLGTDGGQAAMREFKRVALLAAIAAQQAELAKL